MDGGNLERNTPNLIKKSYILVSMEKEEPELTPEQEAEILEGYKRESELEHQKDLESGKESKRKRHSSQDIYISFRTWTEKEKEQKRKKSLKHWIWKRYPRGEYPHPLMVAGLADTLLLEARILALHELADRLGYDTLLRTEISHYAQGKLPRARAGKRTLYFRKRIEHTSPSKPKPKARES